MDSIGRDLWEGVYAYVSSCCILFWGSSHVVAFRRRRGACLSGFVLDRTFLHDWQIMMAGRVSTGEIASRVRDSNCGIGAGAFEHGKGSCFELLIVASADCWIDCACWKDRAWAFYCCRGLKQECP